jgi:lipoate-protein ligase A
MALDETLLHSALRGVATLRFYGWDAATLSLGYFQPESVRHHDAQLAALPWVRRPSGGATLVHHHEVTYALALPPGEPWQTAGPGCSCWLRRMHEIIAGALASLGVPSRLHTPEPDQANPGFLCFRHFAAADVLIGQAKVVGSAQRRQRGALLQHGAILLASSPWAPILPGILELTACRLSPKAVASAVADSLVQKTNWTLAPGELTAAEREAAAELTRSKYAADAWNRKR